MQLVRFLDSTFYHPIDPLKPTKNACDVIYRRLTVIKVLIHQFFPDLFSGNSDAWDAVGLLVLLRLWRIVRIVNGMPLSVVPLMDNLHYTLNFNLGKEKGVNHTITTALRKNAMKLVKL